MFYLGKTSLRRIKPVNLYLRLTIGRFLVISTIDITIPWMGGKRTAPEQNKIFNNGYSRCDGYEKKSFHQSGDALDSAAYKNKAISNTKKDALTVAYFMQKAFNELKKEGAIPQNIYLHQGIFWGDKDLDNDGFLTEQDKIGWDARHVELRSYPQKGVFEIKL